MPQAKRKTKVVLRYLKEIQSILKDIHYKDMEVIASRLPVGGSHMDTFFRLEGLTGMIEELSKGSTLNKALKYGKERAKKSVKAWNAKREFQVHRAIDTASPFLESKLRVAVMRYESGFYDSKAVKR